MSKDIQLFDLKGLEQRVTFKETGLSLSDETTYEEWGDIGSALKTMDKCVQFWIGDWVNFGERKWGEKYKEAVELTGYENSTLRDIASISSKVDMSLRNDKLGFHHHKAVAPLEHKEQEKWLKKAEEEDMTVNELRTAIKRKDFEERVHKQQELPEKKYNIIYADPPWQYFEGGHKNQSNHYSTMTLDDIKALPVADLAADDCILFLWVTFPILKEAFDVIESWGFEYSTVGFNWVKRNKSGKGWFFGLGAWTRANSELCLIARKGSVPRQSASVSQVLDDPIMGHSKKPEHVHDKIVELVGDLPKVELFAREAYPGWDTWGNEV